ncbi:hypothetical protein CHS0354_026703 [Potamilus streckersoni]|uniref:Ubiquitin-associated domain-containing protein 1 n=1 Tax=Potamilus streckersoni TaxID=2493646 RepID=A0AAE0S7S9_9BIVA|nr:hypothetical protein CHS0354_026703 [Potamilus streckersoni]
MFVSDSSIFPPSTMKVRVTIMNGMEIIVDSSPELTVDKLKVNALSHFDDPAESVKSSLYHKVILVRTGLYLSDEKTLQDQGVQDNDELLLLRRRLVPTQFEGGTDRSQSRQQVEDSRKGPTLENIERETEDIPPYQAEGGTENTADAGAKKGDVDDFKRFQTELRRILISLIEASQKLLCLNPEASKIFKQAEAILSDPPSPKIDESSVKQLTDMGFPENRAKKALLLNSMSVMSAMEWLLQHENDPDIDSSFTEKETPKAVNSSSMEPEADGAVGGKIQVTDTEVPSQARVSNILQSLRAYKKREFTANPKALQHLIEMGFDEKDATEALRLSRNDREAACEWLLGDRKQRPDDVDKGLDTDGPIYKAIMANPTVQLGLNNPRCLLAFIQMLEQPHTASQWLNDAETAPVLIQVSRIYHAEKNSEIASSSKLSADSKR